MSVPGGIDDGAKPADRPSARTLVIIPTYNERDNLMTIVSRVNDSAPGSRAYAPAYAFTAIGVRNTGVRLPALENTSIRD